MSAAYTPGPWRYEYEPGYCGEIIARNGQTICTFTDEPLPSNARLIAAAPDLLAALMDFSEAMRQANDTPHLIDNTHALQLAVNSARAAITNATETQL